jgi:hypothetical protein
MITFLAKQAKYIPHSIFEYLDYKFKKFKIDLRGVKIGRVSAISSVFACVLNMRQNIVRCDLS